MTKGKTIKHGITHKIVTKGHPVFARTRRLAPDKLVTAKREFDEMIKLNQATASGHLHYTWSLRKTETGDHAATIAV